MHIMLQLLLFWALAFGTLCVALVLTNIYSSVIDSDLSLHSIGKEGVIAGIASLVEAASVWAVLAFLPAASRALIIPALVVALIYKVSHLEDWSRYDIFLLMGFQAVIACSGAALFSGHFQLAIAIVGAFAVCLTIIAVMIRSL
jgi:hypothetical protein